MNRPRRRCSFSLRTLILLTAIAGPSLGYGGPRLAVAIKSYFAPPPAAQYPPNWIIY